MNVSREELNKVVEEVLLDHLARFGALRRAGSPARQLAASGELGRALRSLSDLLLHPEHPFNLREALAREAEHASRRKDRGEELEGEGS